MIVAYILITLLAVALFFVCRDNNQYADDLTDAIKKAEK